MTDRRVATARQREAAAHGHSTRRGRECRWSAKTGAVRSSRFAPLLAQLDRVLELQISSSAALVMQFRAWLGAACPQP